MRRSSGMHLPSELEFGSFLQYAPRGTTNVSRSSKTVCSAIKNDFQISIRSADGKASFVWAIQKAVERIEQTRPKFPLLDTFFGPDRILIPVPRSAPFRVSDALWPARRICDELVARGLGAAVMPALIRHTAVTKSATAPKGCRPMPPDHFRSTSLASELPLFSQKKITIVDDVITRGSTFIGMSPHVAAAFPDHDIRCFALVRTISVGDVETLEAPAAGSIEYSGNYLHREP
jgi:hypothetical protein